MHQIKVKIRMTPPGKKNNQLRKMNFQNINFLKIKKICETLCY